MRVDENRIVCGVSASALRKLLFRPSFSTPEFMKVTAQGEPLATETLVRLEEDGWLHWDHQAHSIDRWKPTDQGHRLTATRFIKRFPIAVGLKIVEDVVEQARRINRDPTHSVRITELYLFGSVLKGSADGTAGDVDIVSVTKSRTIDKLDLEGLRSREFALFPNANFFERFGIPERIVKRELRSISTKIALHQSSDLDLPGLEYRQIYAFDVEREIELPFDPTIHIGAGEHADPVPPTAESPPRYPPRPFRPWPAYHDLPQRLSIDGDTGREAEHMWQNGALVEQIAAQTHRATADLIGFLASRSEVQHFSPRFDASLAATIHQAVPGERNVEVAATVNVGRRGHGSVEVVLYEPQGTTRLGRGIITSKNDLYIHQTRPDLVPILERAVRSAELWRTRMRAPTGGLRLHAFAALLPGEVPRPGGETAMSFKTLLPSLKIGLDELWDRGSMRADEVELVVDLSGVRPRVQLLDGWGSSAVPRRVPKHISTAILTALKPLTSRWHDVLSNGSYSFGLQGTHFLKADNDG